MITNIWHNVRKGSVLKNHPNSKDSKQTLYCITTITSNIIPSWLEHGSNNNGGKSLLLGGIMSHSRIGQGPVINGVVVTGVVTATINVSIGIATLLLQELVLKAQI